MLELFGVIVPKGLVRLEAEDSYSQSYSLPSIDLIANQEKRSLPVASFIGSESPLSSINWISDETVFDSLIPASSINLDLPLSIDPRLLNKSDPQPNILPS